MAITGIALAKPTTATIVAAPYAPAALIVSTTSNSTANVLTGGDYTFVVNDVGLGFSPGMRVRAAAQDDPSQFIEGIVSSFDGTNLVIASDLLSGVDVLTGWNIALAGQPGPKGDRGDTGAVGPQGPAGGLNNPNVILTGTPTAPTAGATDVSMQIANTTWVRNLLVANYQPLDPDLTALAAASSIAIYYRSAAGAWSPVVIGSNMVFDTASGTLSATLTGTAPLNSPAFTGDPTRVTAPAAGDSDASIPTTAWVQGELASYAKLAGPTFSGTVSVPTAGASDNSNAAANTSWVQARLANMQPLDPDLTSLAAFSASGVMAWRKASGDWRPVVIGANLAFDTTTGTLNASGGSGGTGGIPEAPTDGLTYGRRSLSWVQVAAFSDLAAYAPLSSPVLSGTPRAPTAAPGTNTDQIATTAFVATSFASLSYVQNGYLPLTGGNLTGDLALIKDSPAVSLYATPGTTAQVVATNRTSGQARWALNLSDGTAESGGNTGANFHLDRYADNGVLINSPIAVNRANGVVTIDSANLTGDAKAVTPATSDNDQSVATTAFVQAAIAAALSAAAPLFSTGDVKMTLKTIADAGWVFMNDGSIGDGTSGATTRANADCQALFVLIWTNVNNTWAPVSGGRGADALSDFNAHKRLTLPRALGRALVGAGAGAGLSTQVLGSWGGEEKHTQTVAEMVAHAHGNNWSGDPSHTHALPSHAHNFPGNGVNQQASYVTVDSGSGYNVSLWGSYFSTTGDLNTSYTVPAAYTGIALFSATANNGSGSPFNVIQPSLWLNIMVKL